MLRVDTNAATEQTLQLEQHVLGLHILITHKHMGTLHVTHCTLGCPYCSLTMR